MTPVRRERKNPQLETRLLEYRQWTRTYGGYHSSSTVPQQVRTIRRFEELCNMLDPKSSSDVIPDEIVRESERGVKPQSLNHIEYDIEAWSRFLGTTVHLPRFRQSPMTESWIPMYDDVAAIRRASYSFPDRAIRSRNSCIIDLLFTGGMRIGELIRVNLEDLEGDLLHIRSEKNVRPRIIGLPQSLTERINEYILTSRSPTDPFVLFTTEIGRLNHGWARNLVKNIALKAGVPRLHAHAARHWCATRASEKRFALSWT